MIKINAPKFWYQQRGLLAYLLYPLSIIYGIIFQIKKTLSNPYQAPMKIICVGNAGVGGSGKTPIAILVAKLALEKNIKVGFLTRGYGGNYIAAMRVDPDVHNARLVGDEPLILAKIAPVYVARNRKDGIRLAQQDQIDLIIMDDGMQNHQLKKDLTILVIDGKRGFGNGFILPAGPLRQSVSSAYEDADCMVVSDGDLDHNSLSDNDHPSVRHPGARRAIGSILGFLKSYCLERICGPYRPTGSRVTKAGEGNLGARADIGDFCGQLGDFQITTNKSVIHTKTEAITDNIKHREYVAFAGLGNNEKFYDTLEKLSIKIIARKSFPDHYNYTKDDLDELVKMGKYLITTEKDYVKIPKEYHDRISCLPIVASSDQIQQLRTIIHELI
jgi:tetraacyldisaccharide-1-P 4'-kinase